MTLQTHKSRIGDLQCQARPVDSASYAIGGLSIGQVFRKLHDRDQRQLPGKNSWLS
jgi:hypothetical protein